MRGRQTCTHVGRSIRASGRQQARARLTSAFQRSGAREQPGRAHSGQKAILRGQPTGGVRRGGIGSRSGNVSRETVHRASVRGKIGSRSGNVSRETVRRVSVRAKTGKGRCATEKRQRPTFPCVGELPQLGKTFHVKRRCRLSVTSNSPAPEQDLSRGMPCLKAFHVKQTSKALSESFIRSGEFYKKRSVAAVFAQAGPGGRLVCADSCCCGAERVLLRSSGTATAVRSNRSCATGDIATQATAETIGGGICAGTPCFPDCTQSGRSLNWQTARQAKNAKTPGAGLYYGKSNAHAPCS